MRTFHGRWSAEALALTAGEGQREMGAAWLVRIPKDDPGELADFKRAFDPEGRIDAQSSVMWTLGTHVIAEESGAATGVTTTCIGCGDEGEGP